MLLVTERMRRRARHMDENRAWASGRRQGMDTWGRNRDWLTAFASSIAQNPLTGPPAMLKM